MVVLEFLVGCYAEEWILLGVGKPCSLVVESPYLVTSLAEWVVDWGSSEFDEVFKSKSPAVVLNRLNICDDMGYICWCVFRGWVS